MSKEKTASEKFAVSNAWVASKVQGAKAMPGRVDRFFNKAVEKADSTLSRANSAGQKGMTHREVPLARVSDRYMTAAGAAAEHPRMPKTAGFMASAKEVLTTPIPGTKPWVLGRSAAQAAPTAIGKSMKPARSGLSAGARDAHGAWDVSRQAEAMGLHKAASPFGKALEQLLVEKVAEEPVTRMGKFLQGAGHEAGPAAGATIGAGIGNAYGGPGGALTGAALGYGAGSLPSILGSVVKKKMAG